MSESEKLEQTITEFQREVDGLTADITNLEEQLVAATQAAELAIVQAERQPGKAAERAAVDAEQERSRLAGTLTRKRLALQAATSDLEAARHGLQVSQKGAGLIQLQTMLEALAVTAAAVDDAPTDLDAWATLKEQLADAGRLYRSVGGQTPLINGDLPTMAKAIFNAYGVAAAQATKTAPTGASAVEIPRLTEMLRLNRARGLVRELGGN